MLKMLLAAIFTDADPMRNAKIMMRPWVRIVIKRCVRDENDTSCTCLDALRDITNATLIMKNKNVSWACGIMKLLIHY